MIYIVVDMVILNKLNILNSIQFKNKNGHHRITK